MQTNKAFYFEVSPQAVPWGRLVHFYGRATDFPTLFSAALAGEKEAIEKIGGNIEHQDGIIMATPFAVLFLCRLLALDGPDKAAILQVLLRVARACQFQEEFYAVRQAAEQPLSIQELLAEQHLWPVFESDEQDEITWEEFNYGLEYYSWLYYTRDILQSFSSLLRMLAAEPHTADLARQLLLLIA